LQTYEQCYELNKVNWQYDMPFLQTLNKFPITTQPTKVSFSNSIFYEQSPKDFIVPYIYYTNTHIYKNTMKKCLLTQ